MGIRFVNIGIITFQNNHKMGDLSRQMICSIALYLFVVFVSFPLVRSAVVKPRYVSNTWTFTEPQKQAETVLGGNKTANVYNQTSMENMLNSKSKENNMFTRLFTLSNLKKILDSFLLLLSSFTENTNTIINRTTAETATDSSESDVIQPRLNKRPGLSSTKTTTTNTDVRARPKWLTLTDSSEIRDFLKDMFKSKTNTAHDVLRRRQKYQRRRRSFSLWDYGFSLDEAFEDDTSDVVFGAHTSPCDIADRHYCLNGGTCVFVGALEIKTCR